MHMSVCLWLQASASRGLVQHAATAPPPQHTQRGTEGRCLAGQTCRGHPGALAMPTEPTACQWLGCLEANPASPQLQHRLRRLRRRASLGKP